MPPTLQKRVRVFNLSLIPRDTDCDSRDDTKRPPTPHTRIAFGAEARAEGSPDQGAAFSFSLPGRAK
jgi:hypothetical protein